MWKIEVTKNGTVEHHVWHNKCSDDFIRFLPDNFMVDKTAIKMYMLNDAACKTHSNLMAQMDLTDPENPTPIHIEDMSEAGKIKVRQASDNSLVYTLTGQEVLWSDMYCENMKFTCPMQA